MTDSIEFEIEELTGIYFGRGVYLIDVMSCATSSIADVALYNTNNQTISLGENVIMGYEIS